MNSSRRFFTKTVLSLAALLFIGGCGPEQTQTQTSANLEIVEHDNFKIEYDRENLKVNFILKGDELVTIVSTHDENGAIKLSTPEGETILVLAQGDNEYKSPPQTIMGFGRNDDGSLRIRLFNKKIKESFHD
ncbi:MAG: hypothetical protein LBF13_01365 [Campylobacteraceae bacterium]|jgi:hypothetical protein|nr:hypothetical protein [Campylobacteraceae bacterium]